MSWIPLPEDHPTPSLVVDAQTVEQNLMRMQQYCHEHRLSLRPHTKTHKSIRMAQRQIALGAKGLTVAKVGEAQQMFQASRDLFLAYPAIGTSRLQRLETLVRACADQSDGTKTEGRIAVGIDSLQAAERIAQTARKIGLPIGIMVDLDVGFHRTGVESSAQAVELCAWVSKQTELEFRGVMCFPGHILPAASTEAWSQYQDAIASVVDRLNLLGIDVPVISGGSTPTAKESHRNPILNEIRPGTYIYNDWNEVSLGVASIDDCAARVVATVVSVPSKNKFIVDAGSKTLSSDRNCVEPESGFGKVVDFPEAKVSRLSEEHGEVVFPETHAGPRPQVGERVWIIPNHICVCVNLQNSFFLYRQDSPEPGGLEELAVDARGMLV
ncbi:MAG: alanine racemase [Planctomycetota bacterium]|nr:alanine racemase [Planctomycetota bacterium]